MPTAVGQSALEANLACLGDRNTELAQALERIEPAREIEFHDTDEGVSATYLGRPLASRHRPLSEARRLVEDIDLVEHAVCVIMGFGLGHHVRILAEQIKKRGLIVVFEPDLALLRAVFERIDHSTWMAKTNLIWITDPGDRGAMARKLENCETILGLGLEFIDHPASRTRLGEAAVEFSGLFRDHMTSTKTNLMTTLIRSLDTIRNFVLNLDHYAAGSGIADLKDIALDRPAVIVSAGPSLDRNMHLLAKPGVRERCVIIATQTTLKPLLDAGVKPHYVTALDYHEISRRFYENLDADLLRDVTLVAEAKAHPVILDVYPGPVRCCTSQMLDQLLGDLRRDMGDLPLGSTVAHLAMYLARYLGCNPIAMIGQDLGFTDGLYYAPGTAIENVWAPELNPFNTIEMMQWQRIVRHRQQLKKTVDAHGKWIYTDEQMVTYLNQFERDFAKYLEEGITIIDATEGGVAKQHVETIPLREVLDRYAIEPLPELPIASIKLDPNRLRQTCRRVKKIRQEIIQLRDISKKSITLLRRMIEDQDDLPKMTRHFEQMDRYRAQVDQRMEAFTLVSHLNQLGQFNRIRADRRLNVQDDLTPLQRQRAELERDLQNVIWIEEASQEMTSLLTQCVQTLDGKKVETRNSVRPVGLDDSSTHPGPMDSRIAALVAIDPERIGQSDPHSLAGDYNGHNVLQATLQRLGESQILDSIVLITPDEEDVEALIDRSRIGLPIEIERCEGSPFGVEHEAITAARRWSESAWRGGIAGLSIYDEVLCPTTMSEVMRRRALTAALIVGPDWPLLQVTGEQGCDALVRRHLDCPEKLDLVFTQAPPGLGGCLISALLMEQLAQRNRLATIGALLVYQPHAPQHDPIARDANVQIDHPVRDSFVRATYDSPHARRLVDQALESNPTLASRSGTEIIRTLESAREKLSDTLPRHLIIELTPKRLSRGVFRASLLGCGRFADLDRPDMTFETAKRLFDQMDEPGEIIITFGGIGDPLLHPDFDRIIRYARDAGAASIHVRTELLVEHPGLDRLLECGADVISVDLHADRAATYECMMGFDRFKEVLLNIEYLLEHRRRLTPQTNHAVIALPWVVPRLQRRAETYDDLESFFDRWQQLLGTAVLEGPPPFEPTPAHPGDTLRPAPTPVKVMRRELRHRMIILSDGSVPVSELDVQGVDVIGSTDEIPLRELWRRLLGARRDLQRTRGLDCEALRTLLP